MKKKILCTILAISVLTGCGTAGTASGRGGNTAPTVNDILNNGLEENTVQDAAANGDTNGGNPANSGKLIISSPDPTPAPSSLTGNTDPAGSSDGSVSDAADGTSPEDTVDLSATEGIDVDLTLLSSTMVYSEVYNMMYLPENYVGKVIKMEGIYYIAHDDSTGADYRCCIIQDATACCAQGIEFVPDNPDACPEEGDIVTVVGTFDTYMEGQNLYCTLRDANVL